MMEAFRRVVYDIESDELLLEATRMWILVMKCIDTGKVKYWLEGDLGWMEVFNKAKLIVGHNITGFDEIVLKKLFGFKFKRNIKIIDTLIFSRVLDYRRFGDNGHSLETWGLALGHPKGDFDDWSAYSLTMLEYAINDVELGFLVFKELMKEYIPMAKKYPLLPLYLKSEHYAARWLAESELLGWPFNRESAEKIFKQLAKQLNATYKKLTKKLGTKVVPVDKKYGEVIPIYPKWTKEGAYHRHIADWFGVDPWSGYEGEERIVEGPFSRIKIVPLSLNSPADVKMFLYRHGWQPTEWNTKFREGRRVKTSPKITEDSIEFLGSDGALYTEFSCLKSRYDILKGWLANLDENDRLHGTSIPIGTPSMRARHNIIVNVPTPNSVLGKEFREMFICPPGWKIIGCDSSGNQARSLAHYLGDQEYAEILINSDIHAYNAIKIEEALSAMGVVWNDSLAKSHPDEADKNWKPAKRAVAKKILYAFLFGASGAKLWNIIFGISDERQGNQFKDNFIAAVPGFKTLIDKLKKIYYKNRKTGYGYIPSLVGNKIYVDSPHKLLVYLLQAAEKITCSLACMRLMEALEDNNIEYYPLIFYHDELDFITREEDAERAAELGVIAFRDSPKELGISIMDGTGKIGNTWYDVH